MARYVIDAPTLLHLLDSDLQVDPGHRLVAPNIIRSVTGCPGGRRGRSRASRTGRRSATPSTSR